MKQTKQMINILFVYLALPRQNNLVTRQDVTELWQLVGAMGDAQVVDLIIQKGPLHESTYIGHGKAEEITQYLAGHPIDVVICNGILKPRQKFNLTQLFWSANPAIEVWDRTDLILAIFARHARTTEAKLQIKLAQMLSMGPRIYGMGKVLSQQGAGIGTRGIGETNTELMLRHWKRETKRARDELSTILETRGRQMDLRKQNGIPTVSLVGYTNAGKTSLFNVLTGKTHLVKDQLFATLDSAVGKMYPDRAAETVLVSDTIGFIANLPPMLIEAFKSTLMETVRADAVLHVADISDPAVEEKITVVQGILRQLDVPSAREILVFNKMDALQPGSMKKPDMLAHPLPWVGVSAKTKEGIDSLIRLIQHHARSTC